MASLDKYRSYLSEEEINNTTWKSHPPNYDVVNKLFEEGRTNIWAPGSLEEKVQRLVKTYEMELVHKANPDDYKTLDPNKFTVSVNGRKPLSLKDKEKIGGGYNVFLQTSLPENLQIYKPAEETFESSQKIFTTTFPRGFALEVLQVYSGPPVIVYKFKHWGYMEGPFKGHEATGEMAQFLGVAIFEMNEHDKIVKAEFFYDRGELLAGLVKGKLPDEHGSDERSSSCPLMSKVA